MVAPLRNANLKSQKKGRKLSSFLLLYTSLLNFSLVDKFVSLENLRRFGIIIF